MSAGLTAFWDSLSASERRTISGSKSWKAGPPDVRIALCVKLFRKHGLSLDDALALCRFEDGLGSKMPLHADLLRAVWLINAEQQEKEEARRAEVLAKMAKYLVITDEPWEAAMIPPRPWLAPPYLMRGELTLPHGPGGGGKSQLAIAWAVGLSLGRPFGRLQPKHRCRVLLTNFEDNSTEQMRRITAALEYFGATPAALKGWLYRACVGPNGDATMFDTDEFGAVRHTECWHALEAACEMTKPDLVFLDPLVAVNAVPESDNTLMRRVMVVLRAGIAQRFNCALVPLHHDNKSGDDSDSSDQNNVRGAGDIVNAVRFELAVKKMTVGQAEQWNIDPDRRGYYFRVGSPASKLNYSAPEESEWFERLAVVVNGESVVRCIPWDPPSGRLDDDQLWRLIEAVEKGTDQGPYSPQLGNTKRSLTPVLEGVGIESAGAQRRALKGLMQSGRVEKAEWKRPGRGAAPRIGLRTKDGLPYNYEWCDAGEAETC